MNHHIENVFSFSLPSFTTTKRKKKKQKTFQSHSGTLGTHFVDYFILYRQMRIEKKMEKNKITLRLIGC